MHHPNLSKIQYSNFFNLCRMKGISFDLQEKEGTAFNLVDSFATGVSQAPPPLVPPLRDRPAHSCAALHCFARAPLSALVPRAHRARPQVLGVMGVGATIPECFSTVERALMFVEKQVGVHVTVPAGTPGSDANFGSILAAIKCVVNILSNAKARSKKGGAKKKS